MSEVVAKEKMVAWRRMGRKGGSYCDIRESLVGKVGWYRWKQAPGREGGGIREMVVEKFEVYGVECDELTVWKSWLVDVMENTHYIHMWPPPTCRVPPLHTCHVPPLCLQLQPSLWTLSCGQGTRSGRMRRWRGCWTECLSCFGSYMVRP